MGINDPNAPPRAAPAPTKRDFSKLPVSRKVYNAVRRAPTTGILRKKFLLTANAFDATLVSFPGALNNALCAPGDTPGPRGHYSRGPHNPLRRGSFLG